MDRTALDAVLASSPPSPGSLRCLARALRAGPPPSGASALRAPLAAVLLAAGTSADAHPAAPAAAALVCVLIARVAPRAHDALVFDTLVHKMVAHGAKISAASGAARKGKANTVAKKLAVKHLGCDGNSDDSDIDGSNLADHDVRGSEAEDTEAFWSGLVVLVKETNIGRDHTGFATSVAHGLAGCLLSGGGALAIDGFSALIAPAAHGTPSVVVKASYTALLPLAVRGKLPAATRSALGRILNEVSDADNSVSDVAISPIGAKCDVNVKSPIEVPVSPDTTSSSSEQQLCKRITLSFLQNCCTRIPDRAEDRAAVAATVMRVVEQLDGVHIARFVKFVGILARQPRALLRVFAVELAVSVLPLADNYKLPCVTTLVGMLLDRASDKTPAVRAKAIACLATAANASSEHGESDALIVRSVASYVMSSTFDIDARADDPKSGVRKSIVQLVSAIACTMPCQDARVPKIVKCAMVVRGRCEDAVSTVRRGAMVALTDIVQRIYTCEESRGDDNAYSAACLHVTRLWMDGVLPRVVDPETAAQETCLDAFESLILNPLSSSSDNSISRVVQSFLCALCGGDSPSGRYTGTAVGMLCSKGKVGTGVVVTLQNFVLDGAGDGNGNDVTAVAVLDGAWALLAEIIESDVKNLYRKITKGTQITEIAVHGGGGRNACRIAAAIAASIPDRDRQRLSKQFFTALSGMCRGESKSSKAVERFGMDAIPVVIRALASLDPACGDQLLSLCDTGLSERLCQWDQSQLLTVLIIAGETCVAFSLNSEPSVRLVNHIQALMERQQPDRVRATALAALGKLCVCDVGCAGPLADSGGARVSKRVGFGESLSRRSIPLFVRELNDGASIAARVNSLVVLCDLCRRYTSIVEPHLARLAMCLRDESEVVRQRALASLTSLMQEDFLKLRGGPLFFRLALSLLDKVAEVRKSTEYVLSHTLLPKAPMLFSTNFVEVVFVLNNCRVHTVYNQYLRSTTEEATNISLTSSSNARFRVYSWLLARIPLEHRIGLSSRIRHDIILPAVEGSLPFSIPEVGCVVRDALNLITTSELCLHSGTVAASEDDDRMFDDHDEPAASHMTGGKLDDEADVANGRTKAKVLAKLYQIELKEETIPLLLDLKQRLEEQRSPMLGQLSETLSKLFRPYRKELETLIENSTLRAEIEFDLQQQDTAAAVAKKTLAAEAKQALQDVCNRHSVNDSYGSSSCATPAAASRAVRRARALEFAASPEVVAEIDSDSKKLDGGGDKRVTDNVREGMGSSMAISPPKSCLRPTSSSLHRTGSISSPAPRPAGKVALRDDFGPRRSTGRLAETLQASPKLLSIVKSRRKEAIVFDMNANSSEDGDGDDGIGSRNMAMRLVRKLDI
jgi:hypothetical protein